MFEKTKPISARSYVLSDGLSAEERARLQSLVGAGAGAGVSAGTRFDGNLARRAGEALRAVEWSELTARLNAARDFRLLLRTESRAPIEAAAASFGDAAASYFALLDDNEPDINPDALGQSKGPGDMIDANDAIRSEAPRDPARDM